MLLRALVTVAALLATAAPAQAAWVWPVHGNVITTYRNGDDPYAAGQHRGIDIAAAAGTPVMAAAGGEVRFAGTAGSSGLTVSIRTADGAYDTSYLHLSEATVTAGEHVGAGERLGRVGTTGVRSAQRPHLHFGVRDAGTKHAYHDPLAFLPPPPAPPEHPAPAPEPAPVPVPVPWEPGAAPAPHGAPAPRAIPRTAPRGAPAPVPRTLPHRAPRAAPRLAPRGAHDFAPRRVAARGEPAPQSPRLFPTTHGGPLSKPAAREPDGAGARPAPGPDIGLALACLGVLAAAALLGLSGNDRREVGTRERDRRKRGTRERDRRKRGTPERDPRKRGHREGHRPTRGRRQRALLDLRPDRG